MLNINGRNYNTIFWDWQDTLYSKREQKLFDWVEQYFTNYAKYTENYLLSFNINPPKRLEQLKAHPLSKYFKVIEAFDTTKDIYFEKYIKEYGLDKRGVLVVGDNREHEGVSAMKLGLDYLHINEFIESIPSIKVRSTK